MHIVILHVFNTWLVVCFLLHGNYNTKYILVFADWFIKIIDLYVLHIRKDDSINRKSYLMSCCP